MQTLLLPRDRSLNPKADSPLRLLKRIARSEPFVSEYFNYQAAHKFLFELSDRRTVETSLYEHWRGNQLVDVAVDVATMVGCPVGCRFCAATTGRFERALTPKEMYHQFCAALQLVSVGGYNKALGAFQGIGEPSLLAEDTLSAARLIRAHDPRNVISISTTGANLHGIRYWRESQFPIAVLQFSLTNLAPTPRPQLIPRRPNEDLLPEIALCSESSYIDCVNVNYVLIEDVNDSDDHLRYIASQFSGKNVNFRVASLNSTSAARRFRLRQAPYHKAKSFVELLSSLGVRASIFGAFSDTTVSCGQLTFEC
jgi:23S rRNA (adenine2503-C2)-methyltransferase